MMICSMSHAKSWSKTIPLLLLVLSLLNNNEKASSLSPSLRSFSRPSHLPLKLGPSESYLSNLGDNSNVNVNPSPAGTFPSPDPILPKVTGHEPVHSAHETNVEVVDEEEPEAIRNSAYMLQAVQLAKVLGGERGRLSPFPKPVGAAILVSKDGRVMGQGYSSYNEDCVQAAIRSAGIVATPLREWCVGFASNKKTREDIASSTLYLTLEPSPKRRGTELPPMTQLIENTGILRVVIGAPHPIPEYASEGAAALHSAGISVTMGVEQETCENLISEYSALANNKLKMMARTHLTRHNRPLGFLHCSVIDSNDAEAFARNGNAFGKELGGAEPLSMRDFGTYGIAPPPESIWASGEDGSDGNDWQTETISFLEEEEEKPELRSNPMMPWYEQVDAVIATFPKEGNGDPNDGSVTARLNGLKWLATNGKALPPAVQRILVMDANDLSSLPLSNDDPNLPAGVDVEEFWRGEERKPTRILLRHSANAVAAAAASVAASAAQAAAEAAEKARDAIDSSDAETAADAAIACQEAAMAQANYLQKKVLEMQDLKDKLSKLGVIVETIRGGEPIDVMHHLGERSGYHAVVWRAGCWGERGVRSILNGAFQWVSAHLAVDAVGGKFWQLMMAERCVQGACGPERKVKIFAGDEDISLEYCDDETADQDCVLTVDGRPIRHVRLDCRVALEDYTRKRELKEVPVKQFTEQDAPWFL